MFKSNWAKYKEKNGVTPFDILNADTEYIDEDTFNDRYNICLSCPELIKLSNQCKKCGCFMNIKTKLKAAKCPLDKW